MQGSALASLVALAVASLVLQPAAGPPPPARPSGHLELYAPAALGPGERVDFRVESQGCTPPPVAYSWSLSSNARVLARARTTLSVLFLGPDGNRGRGAGAVDVRAEDGPCAGFTAHAEPLVGPVDPEMYNPALDDEHEVTLPAPAPVGPGQTPAPGVCYYVPPQSIYFEPGLASSGRLEIQLLGASGACPPAGKTP